MDVWKFFKAVFQRTNKNWKLILVEFVSTLIMVPIILLGIIIPVILIVIPAATSGYEVEDFIPFIVHNLVFILVGFLIFLIFLLASLVLWAFVSGGVRASLLENILKEKKFEFNTFIANGKKFFGRIVGLWALTGLIFIAIFIILGGLGTLIFFLCFSLYETSEVGAILIGVLSGFIIFIVYFVTAFLLGVFLTIANTYLIVEDAEVIPSMKGSIRFIKKYPGHTFLVVLFLFLIAFGVAFAYNLITIPVTMIPYVGAMFSFILAPVQMGINLYLALFSITAYFILYLWKKEKISSDFQTSTVPEKTM